ncbi:5-oxoprolinase subunit PxpA [Pseudidiomarina sp.]|uniref:5-oxoprolinase subunit PxpA n=1 Tax=Pseudidiomarina sp. TaxID=2081707 RepID=UPI00299D9416|nr:5-oxoprolinase subunit PxpA [Pseudidiomarina sp.]MDX1705689.1 5-oxoprolinase subunit PxpA [Pseudidiomarina sp.]
MLLNCDMGERCEAWPVGDDAAVMPYIDMASIACGFHAGEPAIMQATICLAKSRQVQIGAHPGYPDLAHFGRRSMQFSASDLRAILLYQIGALDALCRANGVVLRYVKPHGALYNDKQKQPELFETIVRTIAEMNRHREPALQLVTLAKVDNRWQEDIAAKFEVQLLREVFADRRYDPDGSLRSREHADAVLTKRADILQQAVSFARGEPITASDGSKLTLAADTLCVHGDNPESIATVAAIRDALQGTTKQADGKPAL